MGFLDDEKKRYEKLKPLLFSVGAQAAGTYRNAGRPFCLADGCSAENLHESLRKDAVDYFRACAIPWHDGLLEELNKEQPRSLPSNHLCCSQTACVNALAPMMRDPKLLRSVFSIFLPELAEPLPMDRDQLLPDGTRPYLSFEWIGTQPYLSEGNRGTRGANATSAYFAFRFRRYDRRIHLVLGEWKYTESYGAKASPAPGDAKRQSNYRDDFAKWSANRSGLPPYEAFFVDPFYQLMRLTLLARAMQDARRSGDGEMNAHVVSVVHVSPDANRQFAETFTAPVFRPFGRTVTQAWNHVVADGSFKPISSEGLLTAIEACANDEHASWARWLLTRYGWWR